MSLRPRQFIVYDTQGGNLYYDADGPGGLGARKFATLAGATLLGSADFSLVA